MTVFVPVTVAAALELRASGDAVDLVGYGDGPALRQWAGEGALDDEEASYIALNHAGVAALLLDDTAPTRLVLAVDSEATGTDELGGVALPQVRWTDVRSLFADDPAAAEAVVAARAAVRSLDLAAALDTEAATRLEGTHDLLWYAPEELDALAGRG
jgi:hypothetical protein